MEPATIKLADGRLIEVPDVVYERLVRMLISSVRSEEKLSKGAKEIKSSRYKKVQKKGLRSI